MIHHFFSKTERPANPDSLTLPGAVRMLRLAADAVIWKGVVVSNLY